MSNVIKLAQVFIFVISLWVCLSYPGAFSPFYAKSEPLLLLLSGAAMFIVATTVKKASSRGEAGSKESGLR
jgi:hypothetical protein